MKGLKHFSVLTLLQFYAIVVSIFVSMHPGPLNGATRQARGDYTINSLLLQWNCRNINTNGDHLKQFLYESKQPIDIICLQSLAVKRDELPVLQGYYYPPFYSHENLRVRTAIYIKNNLQSAPIKSPATQLSTACEVTLKDGSLLKVVNVYYPESCRDCDLKWLEDLEQEQCVVVGDFNAHHEWWDGRGATTDTAGRQLADCITNSSLCLMNDGRHTRVPDRADHNPTAIDLALVSAALLGAAE
jgi:hypothetical protein